MTSLQKHLTLSIFIMVLNTNLIPAVDVISTADTCIKGPFHKDKPGPEGADFKECLSWKERSCCNVNVSLEILHHKSKNLYDFHWDRCGTLSQACETFIKDEECFYQCEPELLFFQHPVTEGYIADVPICASYCDAWFEACKSDQTCVVDWLSEFDYSTGTNHCPQDSECKTFAEVYKDGRGLCNKMWGSAFVYAEDNVSCMVMSFPNQCSNPNICGNTSVTCNADDWSCVSQATCNHSMLVGYFYLTGIFYYFLISK